MNVIDSEENSGDCLREPGILAFSAVRLVHDATLVEATWTQTI